MSFLSTQAENFASILSATSNEAPASFVNAYVALLSGATEAGKLFEFKVGGGSGGSSSSSSNAAAATEETKEPEPESEEEEVVVSFGSDGDDAW